MANQSNSKFWQVSSDSKSKQFQCKRVNCIMI